ncbi:MAG TPA: prepilin-type N-terminal cleavage/methylation domain-containing protein [Candidatus Tectomicrobia bacterium]|nr:prepilin-type N-terminal cleavage/methylation domain-containing protein [Candidatus Tectomicrobia bacterium]
MRPRADAGFTLLEVLVALAVLSMTVVVAIQGFAAGLRLLKLSGDHQRAALVADQKIREVVRPDEGTEEGTEGAYTWRRTVKAIEAPELVRPGAAPTWKVYEVVVQVRWDGDRRALDVTTLRTVSAAEEREARSQ